MSNKHDLSDRPHGRTATYRKGCRCDDCRRAHTDAQRERRHRLNGPPRIVSPHERFWPKVEQRESCWVWTGSVDTSGYGLFRVDGKMVKTHRWAYEQKVGPIPDGLVLDHLCRVRECVNPDHLQPVTHAENMRRARITHCGRGHELTPDNIYWTRSCKRCYQVRKGASGE